MTHSATRRQFLQAAALVPFAAALPRHAPFPPPAADRASIRVGYQIFGWSRLFPAAWWAGAEAVGRLGYLGIEGEYTIAELYEGRESEFADRMQQCGVALAALYATADLERTHERYENRRKHAAAAAFAKRMGCRMIVLGGTHAPRKDAELFRIYAREANEIGQRVFETYGVRLGVHPHTGSLVETRDDIARVMDATDPRSFFLAPDTGHLLAGGSDPVEIFTTFRDRIVHAHLKDYKKPDPSPSTALRASTARGSFVALGEGSIDFRGIIDRVVSRPFDGWLNVELDGGRGRDPADVARDARAYLTGTLGLSLPRSPRLPGLPRSPRSGGRT
jgi:inosose dehydratase